MLREILEQVVELEEPCIIQGNDRNHLDQGVVTPAFASLPGICGVHSRYRRNALFEWDGNR
jgi:hypothetical protein